jgi:hypothetical protein
MRNEAEMEYEQMCAELDHLRECDKASRKLIAELQAKLVRHGICPECEARIVVDYRAGKATNHRCRCGWRKSDLGDEE